jgi:spectinomycin phosphotransferase
MLYLNTDLLYNAPMLEKPDIPDELIISFLEKEYNLRTAELTFLPLGADMGTAVYRVSAARGETYFLKLRKGFEEIIVTVPLLLKSLGIQEIIAPIQAKTGQGWTDFGEYTMILYPFIEGKNGFETQLSDDLKRTLGAAFKRIHSAKVPADLRQQIPQENFSPKYRERMKSFQAQVENHTFDEPVASKLADFTKSKRAVINHIIERADQLASQLQSQSPEFVLCHTDIHGGNILLSRDGQPAKRPDEGAVTAEKLYIVDWDNPLLAPKERDLMFIGGGIDEIWKSKRDEAVFYEGYGKTEINIAALAYYRYERIIEDLAVICEQILLTDEGGADREQGYRWFTSNFEAGSTIEIAERT